MLNVSTATKEAYVTKDHITKSLKLRAHSTCYVGDDDDDYSIYTTSDFVEESFELEQHLCDGSVDYTGCVGSTCKFSLYCRTPIEIGKYWFVQIILETENMSSMTLFSGYVWEINANLTSGIIEYTCYDLFATDFMQNWDFGKDIAYELRTRNTLSISDILTLMHNNSFITINNDTYYYVNFIDTENLPNAGLVIDKEHVDPDKVFGSMNAIDALRYICQINGIFGVIDGEGYISFRKISEGYTSQHGTAPSNSTYPSEETYPGVYTQNRGNDKIVSSFEKFESKSRLGNYEEPVNGVLIKETEDGNKTYAKVTTTVEEGNYVPDYERLEWYDPPVQTITYTCTEVAEDGTVYWDGTVNPEYITINSKGKPVVGDTITIQIFDFRKDVQNYDDGGWSFQYDVIKIVGNPYVHDKSAADKLIVANNIMSNAAGYSYPECEVTCKGLPFMEVGDYIAFDVIDWTKTEPQHTEVNVLILNRTLKGIQHMTDTYSAEVETVMNGTHFIQSMPGVDGITDEYSDADLENRLDDFDESGVVDEKIENAGSLWNVIVSDTIPENLDPRTICFVRGIVTVESIGPNGVNDTDDVDIENVDVNNEGTGEEGEGEEDETQEETDQQNPVQT